MELAELGDEQPAGHGEEEPQVPLGGAGGGGGPAPPAANGGAGAAAAGSGNNNAPAHPRPPTFNEEQLAEVKQQAVAASCWTTSKEPV